jgi:3-methyladenine DNA glycosylase/8-oxoguanine DNA glycosylase
MIAMKHRIFSLTPRGSYSFGLTLAYLRTSPSAILESISSHGFQRALDISSGVVVSVERAALVSSPEPLQVTLWGEDLSQSVLDQTAQHLTRMLTLDIDGRTAESHLLVRDPALAQLIQAYPGFRPVLLGSPWEALLWAVSGQLIGVQQARVIRTRLGQLGDRSLSAGGREFPLLPSPAWIVSHGVEPLRAAGLSMMKARAIVQCAEGIIGGSLPWSQGPEASREDILGPLQAVTGIGPWTAALVGLRGLGQLDTLPEGDAALQAMAGQQTRLTAAALAAHGSAWAPYRGWATYLLWLQRQAADTAHRALSSGSERSTP